MVRLGVVAAAGRDQVELRAAVGVVGQAAVARGGADRDHRRRGRRIGELVETPSLPAAATTTTPWRWAKRIALMMSGMSRRGDVDVELEAQVDHLGAVR